MEREGFAHDVMPWRKERRAMRWARAIRGYLEGSIDEGRGDRLLLIDERQLR